MVALQQADPAEAARGIPSCSYPRTTFPIREFIRSRRYGRDKQFYLLPYQHVSRASLGNVLIIGAGNGNDVAVALSEGARHVHAVEIDPVLVQIGRQYHPARPYQSPRVTVHIADGRQYLQDTQQRYNLIVYALPDSLTALAGQSAIRLESYLLTAEALQAARAHLAPGGTFAMYNYYAPFVLDRYATTIEDVFRPGSVRAAWRAAPRPADGRPDRPPSGPGARLCQLLARHPGSPRHRQPPVPLPAQRDHPAHLPVDAGGDSAGSLLLVRLAGGPLTRMRSYLDLAFMGAAFLLLETKSIVQFALLFGTTWFVNSLVFAGVLVAVYLAVETARWVRLPPAAVLYGALIVALAVAWIVPQEALLGLPVVPRFLAASALAFAPVYLANLVFAQRFSGVESAGTAFAANLLGAMVGGTLEYLSLITGYQFLLIVAGVLYGLAFITGRRRGSAQQPARP